VIADALAPFLADDPGADERVIDELVARGWVERGKDNMLKLTPAGTEVHAGCWSGSRRRSSGWCVA
jgi:hypothetical protein